MLAFSEDFILFAEPTHSTFNAGVYPTIKGQLTDGQGAPLSDVYVYALFPSKTVEAMSSSGGKFFLNPLESYPAGNYTVEVYARSDTLLSRAEVTFEILEPTDQENSDWLYNQTDEANLLSSGSGFSLNGNNYQIEMAQAYLLSANQNTTQIVQFQNDSNSFDSSQQIPQTKFEKDLAAISRETLKSQNKDAFASFVSSLDSLVHAIFWDQFEFTNNISDAAYDAKLKAMDDGKNPQEAMKVYQDEAAVSRSEVSQYMRDLNIKHGFTNSTTQEQFDEEGKIPRNQGK